MYNFRYYAIGHSYLKHGPFNGWQTDGFWGMAASAPENDYFHKFIDGLKASFDCNIEAIAENHAPYERLCTADATVEKYTASVEYAHMREVLESFKPNVISVFIGGGNTPANDEKSLTQFFSVLYELIAKYKLDEATVICIAMTPDQYKMAKSVADKYGFVSVDASFIHEKRGRENPYYAFADYPEYDERAAQGAVEFRTHPNDKGHLAIANAMLEGAREALATIPEGAFGEEYVYEKYIVPGNPTWFTIKTVPKMKVFYFGFNLRQIGDTVVFGSAPGTGASLLAERFTAPADSKTFYAELKVDGAGANDVLNVTLTGALGKCELSLPIVPDMHTYEFMLDGSIGEINTVMLKPSTIECVMNVRQIGFK